MDRWMTQALEYLSAILAAGVILLAGFGLAGLVSRLVDRSLRQREPEVRRFVGRLSYIAVILVAALMALAVLGVRSAALATLLGTLGLGMTLALQDVGRNVVAGVYLRLERPFGSGDRITIRGVTGQILFVGLRTTLLRGDDGSEAIVPNTVILSEVVVKPPAHISAESPSEPPKTS